MDDLCGDDADSCVSSRRQGVMFGVIEPEICLFCSCVFYLHILLSFTGRSASWSELNAACLPWWGGRSRNDRNVSVWEKFLVWIARRWVHSGNVWRVFDSHNNTKNTDLKWWLEGISLDWSSISHYGIYIQICNVYLSHYQRIKAHPLGDICDEYYFI